MDKKIFISHQFYFYSEFELLIEKFKELNWQYFIFFIPEHDPYDYKRHKEIEIELKNQIESCEIFLLLARSTIGNSFWVVKEIEYNKINNNYIIGVIPNDYDKLTPLFVEKAVNQGYVNFNIEEILKLLNNII